MGLLDESYSIVELAEILGVHRVTVSKWIKQGKLKTGKTPGGRYLITKKNIRDFLTEQGMPVPPYLTRNEKKLVVAVDDDKSILELLEDFFSMGEMAGFFELKTFASPLEAALFIGHNKPELVLLDLRMPELSGFDIAEKIKDTSADTKILVITAFGDDDDNRKKLQSNNIDAVLDKPFSIPDLKKAIEKILYG